MKFWGALCLSSWVMPPPPQPPLAGNNGAVLVETVSPSAVVPMTGRSASTTTASPLLQQGIASFLVAATSSSQSSSSSPPSKADVQLLRQAFAEFYGVNRDLTKSEELLSAVIELWAGQPDDERAALYRVRGDCYTLLADADRAYADYDTAIQLLTTSKVGQSQADPAELPAALLGRARALVGKTNGYNNQLTPAAAQRAAADYQQYLKLTSREEWDTEAELIEDGATRNPYAAWEWGSALRRAGQYEAATQAHALAATAFGEIGDKARSVMALLDAGIDAAAGGKVEEASSLLRRAIAQTPGVSSRDVALLQRVIAKEGQGRLALAALLWDTPGDGKAQAEQVLGDACVRLEQMQAQQQQSSKKSSSSSSSSPSTSDTPATGLRFSMDDVLPDAMDVSCYKFKNPTFLDQLGWPEELQRKVIKLETLR